jgi:hypothetical protein
MIKIGSIIIVIMLAIFIWFMLSGLFSKVGNAAIKNTKKFKHKAAEEYTDGKN